ncbi:hypothetical protein DKG77_09675 [Flagellimonas aquimarina]|uniref:DUF1330 domain-containing protein n=1 Tax=Flagellimonas aquimarina TaxID=2201895 RepID=A0A316KY91_9FLAO|nr:DUF1330 domain-containing protein [Allomuricauda koreensis]PWL38521.1 hypothetical protein DKG77_09675 [Allomuricauda koreensis]
MNRGYLIENYTVIDKRNYIPPVKTINEMLKKFNGKFLVATPKAKTLLGAPLEVVIVIEFKSVDNADEFYNSKEYEEYKKLYENTTYGWVCIAPEYA